MLHEAQFSDVERILENLLLWLKKIGDEKKTFTRPNHSSNL